MNNNLTQIHGYNTLIPYKKLPFDGLQYSYCRDYNHISRYKTLRQDVHNPNELSKRYITLETPNQIDTNLNYKYYEVPAIYENRLDLIANRFLGSSTYAWILAYINNIEDGFTVFEGTRLKIPNSLSDLFNTGEILGSIPVNILNIGSE